MPGLTDDPATIDDLATFVAGLRNVEHVDVLPFHKPALPKYEALGIASPLRDTPVPDRTLIERVLGQFRAVGPNAY